MKGDRNIPVVIYIAGYGRSGSTLLEAMLGTIECVYPLGEVYQLFRTMLDKEKRCSCGERIDSCEFWAPITKGVAGHLGLDARAAFKLQRRVEGRWGWGGAWLTQTGEYWEPYCRLTSTLWKRIGEAVPESCKYVVDSSKTAYESAERPASLEDCLCTSIKVIHLIRDVRGIAYSLSDRGLNRSARSGKSDLKEATAPNLRASLGWMLANRAAERAPSRTYLRVRYENLVQEPNAVMNEISEFLNIPKDKLVTFGVKSLPWPAGHQVSGNRLRWSEEFSVNVDNAWNEDVSSTRNAMLSVLCRTQLRRYGYIGV